ncbi:MAG: type III-A CRISPR-associated RAMP protein Csm5 [Methanobrevibacter sp.]|jgi:CRISPR-associated protein Csm5|nr:type III-A CRISPR-associated RAMP protein Csm5 [Candidatus Methanoflexus mossambicus]
MKIGIEVKTPVHIGNGSEYSRAGFHYGKLKKSGKEIIRKCKVEKIYEHLLVKYPDLADDFLNMLSDRNKYLNDFLVKINTKDKTFFKEIISKEYSYFSYLKYPLNNKFVKNGDGSWKDIKSIKECVKTDKSLYIPGSSIKGAIRNCLLYDKVSFNENDNVNTIYNKINKLDKSLNNMMKYLYFGDTTYINNITIFATESFGTNRNTTSFFEVVDENEKLEFDFKSTYNKNIHKSNDFDENELDIDNIFKKIHDFSNDVLNHEFEFILSRNDELDMLEKEYGALIKKNKENSPILCLGMGSGFLKMSSLLKLKNMNNGYDTNLFYKYRKRNKLGKDRNGNIRRYDFPKTRRLIVGNNKPLGWVKLSKI